MNIKTKPLDKMTDREYTYFIKKDKECAEFKQSQLKKSEGIQSTIDEVYEKPFQYDDVLFGLNEEQRKFYMKNKLNVEFKTKIQGGAISGVTSTKWEAYKGFDKISEEQFFQLAGYTDERNHSFSYRNDSKKMIWGGCMSVIVGLIVFSSGEPTFSEWHDLGCSDDNTDDWTADPECKKLRKKWTMINGSGFIMIISGSISAVYGGMRLDKNWAPYSSVQGISEEYNDKLIKEISNK